VPAVTGFTGSRSGCAKITVMVPFRIVPDIWKGSEGYMRP
jgi:hypothetical protein